VSERSSSTIGAAKSLFRPDIEGLRAIAILLVVAYHAGVPFLGGGFIGVDVFFVLSGYLITGLLVREIEKTGTIDLAGFYARRARRLLPAMTLVLVITIAAGALIYPPFEANVGGFGATAVATAGYASNLYFVRSAVDYFGEDRELNPLLHTWSLSVEEQFYLVWPLFIMFAVGVLKWQLGSPPKHQRLLRWMGAAALFSFLLSLYLTWNLPEWAYFLSPARAWEFALGAIALLVPQKRPGLAKFQSFAGWFGLAGVCASAVVFDRTTSFPGVAALLPALSTIVVLRAAASEPNSTVVRTLSVEPLQEIGRLSYSWYLWHWPVLVFGAALISTSSLPIRLGLVVLSLGISVASYRLVEDPIRHNRRLASRNVYSLAMAVMSAAVCIGFALSWRYVSVSAGQVPPQRLFSEARRDGSVFTRKCASDIVDVSIKDCVYGTLDAKVSIALVGDSHAAQWFSALEPIAVDRHWQLVGIAKVGCPMVEADLFVPELRRVYHECNEWKKNALDRIRQLRPLVTVVSSSENYPFRDDEWRIGISKFVSELADSSENVLILRDTPGVEFDVPICLARKVWREKFMPVQFCDFPLHTSPKIYDFLRSAAKQHRNVAVADLSLNICPDGICAMERDGFILYRDSNHLTASFVSSLQGVVSEHIDELLNRKHSTIASADLKQ